jgi:NAD(P)-dependent dehydrogenase (short-subunit alcohol dehydrogenase family)
MAMKFEGKIAMITGGSTGMGLATARRFVKEGMDHFFITGRRKDSLAAAATDIGQNVTAVQISGLPAEECSCSTDPTSAGSTVFENGGSIAAQSRVAWHFAAPAEMSFQRHAKCRT